MIELSFFDVVPHFILGILSPNIHDSSEFDIVSSVINLMVMPGDGVFLNSFQTFETLHLFDLFHGPFVVLLVQIDDSPDFKRQTCVRSECFGVNFTEISSQFGLQTFFLHFFCKISKILTFDTHVESVF